MSDENNVEDAYVITDAAPGASEQEATTGTEPNAPKFEFAFMVLVDSGGNMYIDRNSKGFPNVLSNRDATLIEVRRYAQEIVFDLAAQAAAEYTTSRLEANAAAKEQAPEA